jgi:hypothetical protein
MTMTEESVIGADRVRSLIFNSDVRIKGLTPLNVVSRIDQQNWLPLIPFADRRL